MLDGIVGNMALGVETKKLPESASASFLCRFFFMLFLDAVWMKGFKKAKYFLKNGEQGCPPDDV